MSLAEKLKDAGVDTIGARLTAACIEGLRKYPGDAPEAWRYAGIIFGDEFVCGLMADMQPKPVVAKGPVYEPRPYPEPQFPRVISRTPAGTFKPYQPRVIPPERLEKRKKLAEIIRVKYMTHDGRSWGDVGWHELPAMARQGNEAQALLDAGPANVPNDGRSAIDVMGAERINEILANARTN